MSIAELLHDGVTLLLGHVSVHGRNCEVGLTHLLRQPINLALRVAEDDGLRDGQRVVKVAQSVKFPFLTLNGHEELLDSFQSQLIAVRKKINSTD